MTQPRFKWHSKDYAGHSTAQYEWALELIGKLHLGGHESLLDMGCGDGKVTAQIASFLSRGRVIGMDSSESMIALASKTFPRLKHTNLCFVIMDALYPGFRQTFDVIFSNAALHWVSDHPAMLKGVGQCLKPGGRILFQMGGRGNAADILDLLDDLMVSEKWRPYFKGFSFSYGFYGADDYEKWLPKAGLKPERLELIPKEMTQSGKQGLEGWIRTTWLPYIQQVPEHLRDDFIAEVAETYIKKYPLDADGNVHVKMVRLELAAGKY